MSDIVNTIKNVPETFSSWDSCMSKAYCKWPVIAGIIVAGLVVISILWCVASCICCGATLCTSCVQCITCFGCCGACKSRRGGGPTRYKDDYSQMPPTSYNGYQPHPAPMAYAQPAPQFAQFDTPSKNPVVHQDSLPAMPSWDTATSRRVEDHQEPAQGYGQDVEMGKMGPPARTTRGGYSQVPLHPPVSPMSPIRNNSYHNEQHGQAYAYTSDLGAQRMPLNNNTYDNYAPAPLSPAPTYATNPPQHFGAIANSNPADRLASGAILPTPRDYNQQQTHYQPSHIQHQPQYQSSRSQRAFSPVSSTNYEHTDYDSYRPQSISPPTIAGHPQQPQHLGYDYPPQPQSSQGVRPPSLLQIGRKPVSGSQREI